MKEIRDVDGKNNLPDYAEVHAENLKDFIEDNQRNLSFS